MTVHISDTVQYLLDDWRRNGLKGIRFHKLEVEGPTLTDALCDGKTEQEFQLFRRDYAIFIAEPECWYSPSAASKTVLEELAKRFEADVRIRFIEGCYEYEVERSPW